MDYSASRAELKQHFEQLLQQAARDLKDRVAKGEITREQAEAEYDAIRLRIAEEYKASTTRLDSSPPSASSSSPVSEPTKAQGIVDRLVPGRPANTAVYRWLAYTAVSCVLVYQLGYGYWFSANYYKHPRIFLNGGVESQQTLTRRMLDGEPYWVTEDEFFQWWAQLAPGKSADDVKEEFFSSVGDRDLMFYDKAVKLEGNFGTLDLVPWRTQLWIAAIILPAAWVWRKPLRRIAVRYGSPLVGRLNKAADSE